MWKLDRNWRTKQGFGLMGCITSSDSINTTSLSRVLDLFYPTDLPTDHSAFFHPTERERFFRKGNRIVLLHEQRIPREVRPHNFALISHFTILARRNSDAVEFKEWLIGHNQ